VIVRNSEQDLATTQFRTLALRALDKGEELAVRRRVVVKSMAQIAGSANPDLDKWSNVFVPAFETIARDLISTSSNMEFGFYPMVRPEQSAPGEQSSFEEFAYDYFYRVCDPPLPPGTAAHNFGRGIWKARDFIYVSDKDSTTMSLRVHDTDGIPFAWNSTNQILFPELQNSNPDVSGQLLLMNNIHSIPSKGQPLDEVMACAAERSRTQQHDTDCGVVSWIFSWNRDSFLIQPVYPSRHMFNVRKLTCAGLANTRFRAFQHSFIHSFTHSFILIQLISYSPYYPQLTGVVVSRVSWDDILHQMLADSAVTGAVAVLESEGKSYSYEVKGGHVDFL